MDSSSDKSYRTLPFDRPLKEAVAIYGQRLRLFFLVVLINIGVLLAGLLFRAIHPLVTNTSTRASTSTSGGMSALLPIFAIVIVLLFIGIHSTATAPPRRNRRRTDKGYGKSGNKRGGQHGRPYGYTSSDKGEGRSDSQGR